MQVADPDAKHNMISAVHAKRQVSPLILLERQCSDEPGMHLIRICSSESSLVVFSVTLLVPLSEPLLVIFSVALPGTKVKFDCEKGYVC